MLLKPLGRIPQNNHLERISASTNYRDGIFHNFEETSVMNSGDSSFIKALISFLNKPKNNRPSQEIPSVKTNLKQLPGDKASIVWFGHSSYLISVNGINILVDPVFSGNLSPINILGPTSYKGSDIYSAEDMPDIDVLIITHDHYDHLDYKTVRKLNHKTKAIVTSLGVSSHLTYWGIDEDKITELDWWGSVNALDNMKLTATPARHFSGRSLTRFKTFWSSFILEIDDYTIFIGADSGYGNHFKEIGNLGKTFDIALMETGQYGNAWKQIHALPEDSVVAAKEIGAKYILPVHWAKFSLALHPWKEPIERSLTKAKELNMPVTTPMIGEPVIIGEKYPNKPWWQGIE